MRSSVTLFGTAILAATATAAAMTQPADAATTSSRADRAITAAKAQPAATRFGSSQGLQAVGTIVDKDGTTHVRMHRTYRGLDVVGGDLVVHQSRTGGWEGTSQTLSKTLDPDRELEEVRHLRPCIKVEPFKHGKSMML